MIEPTTLQILNVFTQGLIGLGAISISIVSYRNARQNSRSQALLNFENRWFEINRALAESDDLRNTLKNVNPDNINTEKDLRFVFFVLSQAIAAFHLTNEKLMNKDFYKSQIQAITTILGAALWNNWEAIKASGYPSSFLRDLEIERAS